MILLGVSVPVDEAVWVDAGEAEHEDGGGDEDAVKAGQADQDAVDWVLHLRSTNKAEIIAGTRTNGVRSDLWKAWIKNR